MGAGTHPEDVTFLLSGFSPKAAWADGRGLYQKGVQGVRQGRADGLTLHMGTVTTSSTSILNSGEGARLESLWRCMRMRVCESKDANEWVEYEAVRRGVPTGSA